MDPQHWTKQDFAAAAKTSVAAAAAEEEKPSKKRRSSPSPERGGSKSATKERGRRSASRDRQSASRGVRPSARRSRSRERGKRKDRSRSISPYVLAMERWNKVSWWDQRFVQNHPFFVDYRYCPTRCIGIKVASFDRSLQNGEEISNYSMVLNSLL
jgi:hypothetical protein